MLIGYTAFYEDELIEIECALFAHFPFLCPFCSHLSPFGSNMFVPFSFSCLPFFPNASCSHMCSFPSHLWPPRAYMRLFLPYVAFPLQDVPNCALFVCICALFVLTYDFFAPFLPQCVPFLFPLIHMPFSFQDVPCLQPFLFRAFLFRSARGAL